MGHGDRSDAPPGGWSPLQAPRLGRSPAPPPAGRRCPPGPLGPFPDAGVPRDRTASGASLSVSLRGKAGRCPQCWPVVGSPPLSWQDLGPGPHDHLPPSAGPLDDGPGRDGSPGILPAIPEEEGWGSAPLRPLRAGDRDLHESLLPWPGPRGHREGRFGTPCQVLGRAGGGLGDRRGATPA
jgi:hypothetical protein